MFVAVQTVHKGDTIKETYLDGNRRLQVEKGPGTKVTKVEHSACSKRGTHINSRECFDFGTLVWRTVEAVSDEQAVLVDWDIDNNVPAVEMRDYALYDIALSTTGLGEILAVDGKAYLNGQNARTDSERLDGALHTLIDKVAKDGLVPANDVRRIAGMEPV